MSIFEDLSDSELTLEMSDSEASTVVLITPIARPRYQAPSFPKHDCYLVSSDEPPVLFALSSSALRIKSRYFDNLFDQNPVVKGMAGMPRVQIEASAETLNFALPFLAQQKEPRGLVSWINEVAFPTFYHMKDAGLPELMELWSLFDFLEAEDGLADIENVVLALVRAKMNRADATTLLAFAVKMDSCELAECAAKASCFLDQPLAFYDIARGAQWTAGIVERLVRINLLPVNENLETSYRLAAIRFEGLTATRTSFLHQICAPYLGIPFQSLQGVLRASAGLDKELSRYSCFQHVHSRLERSPSMLADDRDLDLVLRIQEAKRMYLHAGTEVGNSEGNATARARVSNAFGGDETIEAAISLGTKTRSNIQARLETPIPGRPSPTTRVELDASITERDLSHFASCKENVRALVAKLRTVSLLGSHEVAYELADRHLAELEPHASLSMRQSAGHSIKSCISHVYSARSAAGHAHVKLAQELAGFGGDARHVKMSGEARSVTTMWNTYALVASLRGGVLLPLGRDPSLFSDRFQLGGPTSIRAFKINGIGPKDNGDFLGGDLCWAAGLSLFTPIPRREHWPVQLHTFLNAGRLAAWYKDQGITSNLLQMLQRPVVSAGFGFVYSPGQNIRLEVNFALPLAASSSDATRKGFAVGLGVDFL